MFTKKMMFVYLFFTFFLVTACATVSNLQSGEKKPVQIEQDQPLQDQPTKESIKKEKTSLAKPKVEEGVKEKMKTSTPSVAETKPTEEKAPGAQLPNPASQNCIDKGGTLKIVKDGSGGEYGICYFEDNRQCEEWAMFRGECPVGGIKITGYITAAAQFCAITGGEYKITGKSGSENEQGTCTFKNGKVCDVWDYYNGKCDSNQP